MRTFIIVVALMIAFFGCSKTETATENGKNKGPVIAEVGDGTINADDFRAYLSDRPMSPRKRVSKEALEKRLDEMVIEEVLYQEALRLKLDQDPEVRKSIRQMLTQNLMEKQINQKVWEREITDSEYQAYYDKQGTKFNRPEQVRLADIFIAVPPDAGAEKKAELKQKAETVLAEALEGKNKRSGFGPLIRKYSDTPENYRKGDTGFIDKEGKPVGIDKRLAEAAFKLEKNGRISDQVIETTDGYHVVMRIGKQAAFHKPLKSVKNQIKQEIKREELKKTRQAYIEGLKDKSGIRIDESVMAQVEKEMTDARENMLSKAKERKAAGMVRTNPPMVEQRE